MTEEIDQSKLTMENIENMNEKEIRAFKIVFKLMHLRNINKSIFLHGDYIVLFHIIYSCVESLFIIH